MDNKVAVFSFNRVKQGWLALAAGVAAFVLYANTIANDYAIDDGAVITGNEYVQQGLGGFKQVFTTGVWQAENTDLGYYRPLSLVTFAIEHRFFGDNAHVSHFFNALLYGITGWLLCTVLFRFFKKQQRLFPFVVALLFIAHPVHTEVVANIKSRDELLQFLNLLAATYFVLRYTDGKTKWLLLSCFFYYLALLSKETALAGLGLFAAVLYFGNQVSVTQAVKPLLALTAVLVLFLVQKQWLVNTPVAAPVSDIVSFPYAFTGLQLPTAFAHLWHYFKLAWVPYPLSYNYAYNQIPASPWLALNTIAGIAVAAGAAAVFVLGVRERKVWSLGTFVFIIMLTPALGFVLLKGGILAERFLYAPVLGFCILLAWLLFKILAFPLNVSDSLDSINSKILLPVLILLLYSFVTINRNTNWRNDLSIAEHDVNVTPNSCQVHLHYGKKLIDMGVAETDVTKRGDYFTKGTSQLQQAIAINPHYARAFFKLGYAWQALMPNADSAIYYYRRAIDEAPGYALAYKNLGLVYASLGRMQPARQYLQKALEINPATSGVNEILQQLGQVQQTAPAANTDTTSFEYYTTTGVQLARQKQLEQALPYLQKALLLKPEALEAMVNLATCYAMLKNYDKSEALLLKAEKLKPDDKSVNQNLFLLYRLKGDKGKAEQYRQKLMQLSN